MPKTHLEINEVTNEELCEFLTHEGSIDVAELIGAEILDVSSHTFDDETDEIDELKIRLKDGRILNVCGDNIILAIWSDENKAEEKVCET